MTLLQMSISSAILIIIITILRAISIHKLPKKTFLFLWGLVLFRLLIPLSIPSVFSIYSLIPKSDMLYVSEQKVSEVKNYLPRVSVTSDMIGDNITKNVETQELFGGFVSVWTVLWFIGFSLCIIYFIMAYCRGMKKFKTALPLETMFIKEWKEKHFLKRKLSIQSSDEVFTPLSYGIIRPVILLPKNLDLENKEAFDYILTHEYIHIRHFDILFKMLMIIALSIHWFNPTVWVMYLLLNRDIELVCDETVIKLFGEKSRSSYAHTLIDMEIQKSGLMPLCNNFSKHAIHERIYAIMKMKKMTIFSLLLSGFLIVGITVTFVTSAVSGKETKTEIHSTLSEQELKQISALRFDGYEKMSIAEFQEKVWTATDTEEYSKLLERLSHDDTLYKQKDNDANLSFFFDILNPLTAERWKEREFGNFGGAVQIELKEASDAALFEYCFAMTIKNPYTLTVGEYDKTRLSIKKEMDTLLQDKSLQELQNEVSMNTHILSAIERMEKSYSNDKLKIEVGCSFNLLSDFKKDSVVETSFERQKEGDYPHATKEDYQSLLVLKTSNYQTMSVSDFDQKLLEWANEDYERSERIEIERSRQDSKVSLSKEEENFIGLTVWASGMENAEFVRSRHLSKPMKDPVLSIELPSKEDPNKKDDDLWCVGFYQLSYHIKSMDTLSIGERDQYLRNVLSEIERLWEDTDVNELIKMDKKEIEKKFSEIAVKNSNEKMSFSIVKGQVYIDHVETDTNLSYDNQSQMENVMQSGEVPTQGETFAYEEGESLTPDELEKLYSVYKPFGLTYDKKQDCFYYKGKLVRLFIDIMQTNGEPLSGGKFKGTMRQVGSPNGELVISTIRDYDKKDEFGNGTLIGIKEGY